MKQILLLLMCTSLCMANTVLIQRKLDAEPYNMVEAKNLAMSFFSTSYAYSILSMVMYHSDAAYLGISQLIRKLAEDKIALGNLCMNYMTVRNIQSNFFYSIDISNSTHHWNLLNYKMSPKTAMNFVLDSEINLATNITAALPSMDTHAEHFFEHVIMDPQYESVAKIQNLFGMIKRDGENPVYLYEFDRSINSIYKRLFIEPTECKKS